MILFKIINNLTPWVDISPPPPLNLSTGRQLIEENLSEFGVLTRHLMVITDNVNLGLNYVEHTLTTQRKDYRVFFGSNFPHDRREEVLYRIISKIVDCVESGIVCVLSNLNEIYQTFYDLLNQKYTEINGKNYCRVAFGADSMRIHVHENFKFILIEEHDKVPMLDVPLLNRFEKHIYAIECSPEQLRVKSGLKDWVRRVYAGDDVHGRAKSVDFREDKNLEALLYQGQLEQPSVRVDEASLYVYCQERLIDLMSYYDAVVRTQVNNALMPQEKR